VASPWFYEETGEKYVTMVLLNKVGTMVYCQPTQRSLPSTKDVIGRD
jgi:hypothetical protein